MPHNQTEMENTGDGLKNLNSISLSFYIKYIVLETYIRKKMIGEKITAEGKNGDVATYAEILDLSLEKSLNEEYDIAIALKFRTLTKFFRNKTGEIVLNASFDFDKEGQQVSVSNFELDGTSKSWFFNNSLEAIANTFMHGKLKNKMKFDFKPEIEKQLLSINERLGNQVEVAEGVFLSGSMETFKVSGIVPQENQFLILVNFQGISALDIKKIDF